MVSHRILLEQISRLGYRVAIAGDHVEAVNEDAGERFIVRGDDLYGMPVDLARMVRIDLEDEA